MFSTSCLYYLEQGKGWKDLILTLQGAKTSLGNKKQRGGVQFLIIQKSLLNKIKNQTLQSKLNLKKNIFYALLTPNPFRPYDASQVFAAFNS